MVNCFASCKPESNPEAKGVQGFWNEDCVTECAIVLLYVTSMGTIVNKKKSGRKTFILGEEERHGGAISCGEVRRVKHNISSRSNIDLKRASTMGVPQRKIDTERTLMLVDVLAGADGTAGAAPAAVDDDSG
jgi:hypothetical protein